MKLIIDIPEEVFTDIKETYEGQEVAYCSIKYGTPFDSVIEDIKAKIIYTIAKQEIAIWEEVCPQKNKMYGINDRLFRCSHCGHLKSFMVGNRKDDFCSSCGADMRENNK